LKKLKQNKYMDEHYGPSQIQNEFKAVDPKHAAERSNHLAKRAVQRAMHDLELVEAGAEFDERGHLHPTSEQKSVLYSNEEQARHSNAQDKEDVISPEQFSMTPERLKEIAYNSFYAAMPYANGMKDLAYSPLGEKNVRQLGMILDGLKQWSPMEDVGVTFVQEGVPEVVTVAKAEDFDFSKGAGFSKTRDPEIRRSLAGSSWQIGEQKGEKIYVLQYATATENPDGNQKYPYKDRGDTGRNTEFSYAMLLPESQAREVEAAMKIDPSLARQLGDLLVFNTKTVGNNSDRIRSLWQDPKFKPPYDKWRQINGGVDRMAFRTASNQTAEQAQIVEF
jgi:hypothetical protein